ncbi:MAG: AI-2E family transporter [Bacteroidales bacterium]|nr:AI-2E family transporter [Bacteroidales bacterium]
MKDNLIQYIKPLVGFSIIVFMGWYFSDVLAYVLIATFLAMMGTPLAKRFDKLKIRKISMPHTVSTAASLLLMLLVFSLFMVLIVPLIIKQANIISTINVNDLVAYYQEPMDNLDAFLVQYNVINSGETLAIYIQGQILELISLAKFTNFFTNFVSTTGSLFMGAFIVIFLTYFFLSDSTLLKNFILILSPEKYVEDLSKALHDSKFLLVRYFHGVLVEIIIMMTLETIGLLIMGVPNALLIGFFGGLMNVIPYLGPVIGVAVGSVLAVLSIVSAGEYKLIVFTFFSVVGVFGVANLIDNFVLQPFIYSKSVKAHPVEVFLVIIIGGKLAGIAGMIMAIPTFTIIKVVARQFMQQMKLVKYLTSRM